MTKVKPKDAYKCHAYKKKHVNDMVTMILGKLSWNVLELYSKRQKNVLINTSLMYDT